MKYICPLIVVQDISRSRIFYEEVLGQKIKFDFGQNITFYGDFSIHLASHYKTLTGKDIKTGSNNFELYFEEDDLEKTVSMLKEQNVVFVHEIREQPWRQKVIRFYDPDKNIIEIGESFAHLSLRLGKEGMSAEKISSVIQMPVSFVKKAMHP
jgi:catechol 2,3-dioxygenase-like lactoylglutathione lyase family enzyme